jgi:hypothetical protein
MGVKKPLSLGLLALVLAFSQACLPRPVPIVPPGVTLHPGRYIEESYRASGFAADQISYSFTPFTVVQAQGVSPDTFPSLLQTELTRAWEANGLKVAPQGDCVLSGTVQLVGVKKTLRFLIGRISAELIVSGAIRRNEETLFAFQDRIHLTSPVNPGPSAPKESELLLQQVARTLTTHLLDEILLYWGTDAGG